MVVFIALVLVAYVYVRQTGGLDWSLPGAQREAARRSGTSGLSEAEPSEGSVPRSAGRFPAAPVGGR